MADRKKLVTPITGSVDSALPDEIIVQILSYLPKEDAHNLGLAYPEFQGKSKDLILLPRHLKSTETAKILLRSRFRSVSIYFPQVQNGHFLFSARKATFVHLFSILAARLTHDVQSLNLTGLHLNVPAPREVLEWVLTRSRYITSLSLHANQDLELWQRKHEYTLKHLEVTCGDVSKTRLILGNLEALESLTLHFQDPNSLRNDQTYGWTAWGPGPYFLGAAEAALHSPLPHFFLKTLSIHAQPPRQQPGCSQPFTPSIFPVIPNTRVRHHILTGPWQFHDVRHLIDWSCSYTTEALSVHGVQLITDERLVPVHFVRHRRSRVPENWHGRLTSLELHQVQLDGLQRLFFPNLRKLIISDVRAISDTALTAALTSAGEKLETLSISVRFGAPYQVSIMYRSAFVFELLRRVALRRFSSIGPFYFTKVDWEVLCARSFPHMLFVHVDQPNNENPTFKQNRGHRAYVASSDDRPVIPAGMSSLNGGRAFVSDNDRHKWISGAKASSSHSTVQLLRRFLEEADPEGDLVLTREMTVTRYECRGDAVRAERPFRISDLLLPAEESRVAADDASSESGYNSDTDLDVESEHLEPIETEESDPWDLYWEQEGPTAQN